MLRKEGGRGLVSTEDNVDASIQLVKEKRGRRLITATGNNTNNLRINKMEIARKQKWKEKQLYGSFKQQATSHTRKRERS